MLRKARVRGTASAVLPGPCRFGAARPGAPRGEIVEVVPEGRLVVAQVSPLSGQADRPEPPRHGMTPRAAVPHGYFAGVRTRSTEITIATDATITAPPTRTALVMGSSRISAPKATATTGLTYA